MRRKCNVAVFIFMMLCWKRQPQNSRRRTPQIAASPVNGQINTKKARHTPQRFQTTILGSYTTNAKPAPARLSHPPTINPSHSTQRQPIILHIRSQPIIDTPHREAIRFVLPPGWGGTAPAAHAGAVNLSLDIQQ